MNGFVKLSELLIEHGADKEARDIKGRFPLDCIKDNKRVMEEVFKSKGLSESKIDLQSVGEVLPEADPEERLFHKSCRLVGN